MREHHLAIPLTDHDIETLQIGDAVFLSGIIYTGREGLYSRLYEQQAELPGKGFSGSNVTFHCSPAIREEEGWFTITSVTATASFRFAKYVKRFISDFKVKAVIGKSGMNSRVYKEAFVPNGAVYLSTIGYGAGAIYGRSIEKVIDVHWKEELGLAQAVWVLSVKEFGPLIVESDVQGNSLFACENEKINQDFRLQYDGLELPILRRVGEEQSSCNEMV